MLENYQGILVLLMLPKNPSAEIIVALGPLNLCYVTQLQNGQTSKFSQVLVFCVGLLVNWTNEGAEIWETRLKVPPPPPHPPFTVDLLLQDSGTLSGLTAFTHGTT